MVTRYRWAIYGLFLLLLCAACQPGNQPAGKIWFYTHSSGTRDVMDTALTPACFIDLEKNGDYSMDWGHFDYGKWIYADNQLLLTSHSNNKLAVPVAYLTATEMQVGSAKGPFNNFECQRISFSSLADNPFSTENNAWRIKATARETAAQLKNRLNNHFKFWELYFTWALNSGIQSIDVRSTPTPIKIYGNGITLKPFNQLPTAWKMYFFDEADCQAANDKIKSVFDNNNIAFPHTENKYKMFISIFQQLQQKLP